jgi:Na+-transporting methylmalonyl-CoA/oxaloacetate decarboxylase gamma subunit
LDQFILLVSKLQSKVFPKPVEKEPEEKELPMPKAEEVWISKTRSTKQIVVLALYRHATKEGVW